MLKAFFLKLGLWIKNVFQTRKDIWVFLAIGIFILLNILKISLFNQLLVPEADKWMLRFKLLTTALIVIGFYPLLFRFRSRAVFIVFYILQTLYILLNMSYYLYFNNYLHVEQFISNFYEGFVAVMNSSSPKSPKLLLAFLDLPVFIYLFITYFRASQLRKKLRVLVNIVAVLALLSTAYTQYGHYKNKVFITHIARNNFLGESRIVQRYGTLVNSVVSLYYQKNTQEYINSFQYGKEVVKKEETAEKADIFILQVESLDSAIAQQKHNGNSVMPYISSLADESVFYPYVVSYHFGGGTSDTEFSIINSVEPIVGYPAIKLTTYDAPNSFIRKLSGASYEITAFHGNIGRYYNRDLAFHTYGFDDYFDIAKMGMKDEGWGAPDDKVFDFSLQKLEEIKARTPEKPLLSYLITMTSHGPFNSVSNYYTNNSYDDIQDKLVKDYYISMTYVDQSIKEYVKAIEKNYKNAYIFIFGDHNPKIKSDVFKQSDVMIDGKMYEFVPLFIITPDKVKYREETKVATFLDLAPTILNASGISYSIRTDGTDLLNPKAIGGKIPYRGLSWDRQELYRHIAQAMGN